MLFRSSLNIKVIFTQNKFSEKIRSLNYKDVEIYTDKSDLNIICYEENNNMDNINIKEDVAVILFTSGSTGILRE